MSSANTESSTVLTANAFFKKGLEAQKNNRIEDAIQYYSAALERNAEYSGALYNRAIAYFDREQFNKCAEDLDLFLRTHPKDVDALERRGLAAFAAGKQGESIRFFSQALQISESAQVRADRGIALLESGNPEIALEDFSTSLRLDSSFTEAWVGLGNCHLALGQYAKARDCLTMATQKGQKDLRVLFNLGIAYARMRQYREAIQCFDKIPEKEENPEVLAQRAFCLFQLGEYLEARSDVRLAHNLSIKNAYAYNTMALLEIHEGNLAAAEKLYTEALELEPKHAELLCGRGFVRYKLKKYLPALNDLNQAIRYSPFFGEAFYCRAGVRLMLKDAAGACKDYQTAVELGYNSFPDEDNTVFCAKETSGNGDKK